MSIDDPRESLRQSHVSEVHTDSVTSSPESLPTMDSSGTVSPALRDDAVRYEWNQKSYRLQNVIGKGAEGIVWSAIQVALNRVVAVKTINIARERSHSQERFYQEALMTARLDHPNIVSVHDISLTPDGMPLLSMKLVRGRPWSDIIKEDFDVLTVESFLRKHLPFLVQMMQAVAFAHSRGIVHRDLKPSQLMVGDYGEVILLDWGIAILLDSSVSHKQREKDDTPIPGVTPTDSFGLPPNVVELPSIDTAPNPAGTPALMAPEQTHHNARSITRQTDIYLLGGILYFLLTRTYPHDAKNSTLSLNLAAEGIVDPPDSRAPGRNMPPELVELCMKALQREQQNRPACVLEMLEAVQDYLTGDGARRQSLQFTAKAARELTRLSKMGLEIHPKGPQDFQISVRPEASLDQLFASMQGVRLLLEQAISAWSNNPELESLQDQVRAGTAVIASLGGDLRVARHVGSEIRSKKVRLRVLDEVTRQEQKRARKDLIGKASLAAVVFLSAIVGVGALKYSSDQRKVNLQLSAERDTAAELRDEAFRQKLLAEEAFNQADEEAYFSYIQLANIAFTQRNPGRTRQLVLGNMDSPKRHWEWGNLLHVLLNDVMTVTRSSENSSMLIGTFSGDGQYIYTGDRDGVLGIYDKRTGCLVNQATIHQDGIWDVLTTPDGKSLLTTSFDKTATILDAKTLEVRHRLEGHDVILRGAAISPDGTRALTTSRDASVRIWDLATGKPLGKLPGIEKPTYDIEFIDGATRIAVTQLTAVTIHDATTGEVLARTPEHPENILSISFSPDGKRFATACTDRNVRIFSYPEMEQLLLIENKTSWLHSVAWHPTQNIIATGDNESDCRLWDADTGELLHSILAYPRIFHVRFSPDGRHLLTTSTRGVQLWDIDNLPRQDGLVELLPMEEDHPKPTKLARVFSSPLERRSSWNNYDYRFREDFDNGRLTYQHPDFILAVDSYFSAIEPNQIRVLRTDYLDNSTVVEDFKTEAFIERWPHGDIHNAVWSPDGKYLGVIGMDGVYTIHDGVSLKPLHVLGPASPIDEVISARVVGTMVFDPTSTLVYTGRRDGSAAIWSAADGSLVHDLGDEEKGHFAAAFSPNGKLLVSGGLYGRARVWDVESGRELGVLAGHEDYILGIDFHPDGSRIVTSSLDGTTRLWDTASHREIITVFKVPEKSFLLAAGFSDDGRSVFSVISNGTVYVSESLDWTTKGAAAEVLRNAELEKRRRRLNPEIQLADVPEEIGL